MADEKKKPWYTKINPHWIGWLISAVLVPTLIAILNRTPVPPPPPPPDEPIIIQTGGQGWVRDDAAVDEAIKVIERQQGMPAQYSRIAQDTLVGDDNKSVFLWKAESKVLGRQIGSWDQGSVGTCVSFGYGRGAQDLLLGQIAGGAREEWPGHEVATEPIYGGSRVEVGGGRIRGDGSVGAWAAQWVQKWGILFRKKYEVIDLSIYSQTLSRNWGRTGVPNPLEEEARKHPIRTVAQVRTGDELWAALGNGYPVPVCSDVGFEGQPPASGIMEPRGTWGHCMLFRGRFTHPAKGKCVVCQNSWGRYIPSIAVETTDAGRIELPEGCFAMRLEVADRMCRQNDTFALSGFVGFPKKKPTDWFIQREAPRDRFARSVFALAP
jgi:hypothetical protein